LLEHIVHNFNPEAEKDVADVAVIRFLGRFEDILIRNGVLPSDFAVMAMKRRDGPWATSPRALPRGEHLYRAADGRNATLGEPRNTRVHQVHDQVVHAGRDSGEYLEGDGASSPGSRDLTQGRPPAVHEGGRVSAGAPPVAERDPGR
jgi:hypothetical protein